MHLLLPSLALATPLMERVTLRDHFLSQTIPEPQYVKPALPVLSRYNGDYDTYIEPAYDLDYGVNFAHGTEQLPTLNGGTIAGRSGTGTGTASKPCALQSLEMSNLSRGIVYAEATTFDLSPSCSANEIVTTLLIKDEAQICLSEAVHRLCLKIQPENSTLAVIYDDNMIVQRRLVSISDNFSVNFQLLYIKSSGQFTVTCNGREIFNVTIDPDMLKPVASLTAVGGSALFNEIQYI